MTINTTVKGFSKKDYILHKIDSPDVRTLATEEQIVKVGKIISKAGLPKEEQERFIRLIHTLLEYNVGQRKLNDTEIESITPQELELFGDVSKRKVVVAKIRIKIGKYYEGMNLEQKEELAKNGITKDIYINQQVRRTYDSFKGYSEEIINCLMHQYGLSSEIAFFLKAFNSSNNFAEEITDVAEDEGVSALVFSDIAERLPFTGIKGVKIVKEAQYSISETGSITGNYLFPHRGENNEVTDNRNGFINPNWFLYDIDIENAVKLWGVEKAKYIFGRYFRKGIESSAIGNDISLPDFYNLGIFRIKINEDAEGNKKKLIDMGQHIFEWDIDRDFSQENFSQLAEGLRLVLSDLKSSGEPKRFEHPIQTNMGSKTYTGYFSGSKGFENTHLVDIKSQDKNGKRVLRFATDMGQDELLFIMIQVSYFIKNKKLLPSQQLWKEIYKMYNALSLEGMEVFPSSTMKEQYDTLVKKVVWPLSKEHKEKKGKVGKAHNAVLYGVYGTGKSQLLTHLISQREYELPNREKIHLEANVINISIMEFAELIVKSASGFRKRLSDIHENTGMPIVLVIEDIDTIVKEQGTDSDPVSQGITTLFEGIGSLPVTVVASTNSPEILPQRHLRPNRFDVPIGFEYPINPDLVWEILEIHWKKKGLDTLLSNYIKIEELKDFLVGKILDFTPSHISALCLSIYEDLEFVDLETLGVEGIKEIMSKSLNNILVPVKDMQDRNNSMGKWRESLGSTGNKIGF